MKLYLDDDMALPIDFGLSGEDDPVHLRRAALDGRVIVTGNYDDFKHLHLLIVDLAGHHPGVLAVRKDNDPKRDMKAAGIARALRNLENANVPTTDQLIVLNHYR